MKRESCVEGVACQELELGLWTHSANSSPTGTGQNIQSLSSLPLIAYSCSSWVKPNWIPMIDLETSGMRVNLSVKTSQKIHLLIWGDCGLYHRISIFSGTFLFSNLPYSWLNYIINAVIANFVKPIMPWALIIWGIMYALRFYHV